MRVSFITGQWCRAAATVFALAIAGCGDSSSDPGPCDTCGPDLNFDTAVADDGPEVPDASDLPDPASDIALPNTLGGDRPAAVHLPSDYTPAEQWPLLILLHGYGVTGTIQDFYLGLSPRVDSFGFIEVVPEGTPDKEGHQFWDATPACCNFTGIEVDDVAYISGLIEEAKAAFNVDPGRVYLVGHSNGGFMSHTMACERADLVTAIAVIAGSMLKNEVLCKPSKPVTVLQIHGTDDEDVPYDGKGGAVFGYPGAGEVVERWRKMDGCKPGSLLYGTHDYDGAVDGAETTATGWIGCDSGARVDLWKMGTSAHVPAFTTAFKDDLLTWLLAVDRDQAL